MIQDYHGIDVLSAPMDEIEHFGFDAKRGIFEFVYVIDRERKWFSSDTQTVTIMVELWTNEQTKKERRHNTLKLKVEPSQYLDSVLATICESLELSKKESWSMTWHGRTLDPIDYAKTVHQLGLREGDELGVVRKTSP